MFDFVAGLDLGQTQDFSALAILRREAVLDELGVQLLNNRGRQVYDFACIHIERFPLGTSYPSIVTATKELMGRRELRTGADGSVGPKLAIDATGVGRAVVDMFLIADMACEVCPITITGGLSEPRCQSWNMTGGVAAWWVAKVHLVSAVLACLEAERLKVAPRLRFAELLKKELFGFNAKVTAAGNDTFSARDGAHDDLVLAAALAVWLGSEEYVVDYTLPPATTIPGIRRMNSLDRAMHGGGRVSPWQPGERRVPRPGAGGEMDDEVRWRTGEGRRPYRPDRPR